LILGFGSRNSARFLQIVRDENIECDLSDAGWIRIADTPEEQRGIMAEVAFAKQAGVDFELLSPKRIRQETGIPAKYAGRKAVPNGNYHPFKFVCGILDRALRSGVQMYARTPVVNVTPTRDGLVRLETPRGVIKARRVVFATNAFTAALLPEMRAIHYYQSQILNLEHVVDNIGGMTITEKKGDLYYNFPSARKYRDAAGASRGMLLAGGGLDRKGENPFYLRRSPGVLNLVLDQAGERFPETRGQPPSRVWTGPMAFTPDRVPVIGFLRRQGFAADSLIVAAGFNGYGGTYCVEAGRLSAIMATTGKTPSEIPEDMFSPHRFLMRRPLW
jgi:glycine/D-amino acid oxidase-like deaminating enzyme